MYVPCQLTPIEAAIHTVNYKVSVSNNCLLFKKHITVHNVWGQLYPKGPRLIIWPSATCVGHSDKEKGKAVNWSQSGDQLDLLGVEETGQTEPIVTVLGTSGTILCLKVQTKLEVEDETKVDAIKCVCRTQPQFAWRGLQPKCGTSGYPALSPREFLSDAWVD